MLVVSDAAKRRLHRSLAAADEDKKQGKCFRIMPTAHDHFLTLKLAKPAPDDDTFEHNGRTVLALPRFLQRACTNRSLRINSEGRLILS